MLFRQRSQERRDTAKRFDPPPRTALEPRREERRSTTVQFDLTVLPADLLYAADQDMWVRLERDGMVTTGATHLVAGHGQFMFFSPRPAGTAVALDRSLGVMETAKSAMAIHAPLSCVILEGNPAVAADASLVTRAPYEAGWLFRLRPTALEGERGLLLDTASYRTWLASRLDRFERPIEDDPPGPVNGGFY
jgi:glycine cleavage system H protein